MLKRIARRVAGRGHIGMVTGCSAMLLLVTCAPLESAPTPAATDASGPAFSDRFAEVNGVKLHYRIGGKGSPVVLLHGFAETGHMWDPILPLLAGKHTVIVPDLRGAGDSAKPDSGYDKKTMAVDIHELTASLKLGPVSMVGHDIGLMVAYAYAAQFPKDTERLVLMDAFLPGIGDWKSVWLMRDLWHFHFYGDVPLALVKGRERTYLEHFWNDFAADSKHSVKEADRQIYAQALAQPGATHAGFEWFRNFERDAEDFARLNSTPLTMPVLVLTGAKASGQVLIDQARLVATDVEGIILDSGHWLMEEAPEKTMPPLVAFLDRPLGTSVAKSSSGARADAQGVSGKRMDPEEIEALAPSSSAPGTSGVTGIETRVLTGDPSKAGLYTIQLRVPANTRIEAHDHPDDRVATVVSGTWYLGYGSSFDDKALKALSPGSFYTEPPHVAHFARTGDQPVVVNISGFGPTGTRYVDGQPVSTPRK